MNVKGEEPSLRKLSNINLESVGRERAGRNYKDGNNGRQLFDLPGGW